MPAVKDQMYQKAPSWQLVGGWSAAKQSAERANVNVDKFDNNNMYISIRTGGHSGIYNIAVGEKYRSGNPAYNQTHSPIHTLVGSFQIPKAVLNVSDRGAVIKPLMRNSQDLSNDLAMDANRQVHSDGSGTLATAASAGTATTTVPLKQSVNGDLDYSRYFPVGLYIKVGSSAVTSVASCTKTTLTTVDAITFSANDAIKKVNGSSTTSDSLDGFSSMILNSGSYQNLDAATAPRWAAYGDTTTESLDKTTIQSKMFTAFIQANIVGDVKWLVMNAHAFQCYGESLTGLIRFTPNEVLSGGWLGLDFMAGKAKVLLDMDQPDDRIEFLSPDDIIFGEFQPLEWEKGTDGTLFKIASQLDYEVTASWMGNIGTTARAAQAYLANKTFSI